MTYLKALRDANGMTQATLAKKAGVSVRSYRNYEAGRRKPPYDIAKTLAEVFGIPMDKLF